MDQHVAPPHSGARAGAGHRRLARLVATGGRKVHVAAQLFGPADIWVVPAEEPGPIHRSQSKEHGVWVPAFAGTTSEPAAGGLAVPPGDGLDRQPCRVSRSFPARSIR